MKIQSRAMGKPKARYKTHVETVLSDLIDESLGIRVASTYVPTLSCPPDAKSAFFLVFGMDNRRFVAELSREEARSLRDELTEALSIKMALGVVKGGT